MCLNVGGEKVQYSLHYRFLTISRKHMLFINRTVPLLLCFKETATDLLLVQRYDESTVVELGLPDHCLGELHLGGDVGYRYGIIVVICDVQSILDGRGQCIQVKLLL